MKLFNNKSNQDSVVIGYDKKGKPVTIFRDEKFVPTLIIGPAGSGKTTQSLIPMIQQDINKETPLGITVFEPNGDLTARIYADIKEQNDYNKTVLWFNPTLEDCVYFNPLDNRMDDAILSITETFLRINADSPQFFKDMITILLRNAIKAAKCLYGDNATLLDVKTIICDKEKGLELINEMSQMINMSTEDTLPIVIVKEYKDVIKWFEFDYYSDNTKTFENMAGIQKQLTKLMDCDDLRRVLCPPRQGQSGYDEFKKFKEKCIGAGVPYQLKFDEALKNGYIVFINTARSSYRELGFLLGQLMIRCYEYAAIYRVCIDKVRIPNALYIDDFPAYANWDFEELLRTTEGNHVYIHISTQSLAQLGMGLGATAKDFVAIVAHHTKNKIVYPNICYADIQQLEYELKIKPNDIIVDLKRGQIMYRLEDKTGVAKV